MTGRSSKFLAASAKAAGRARYEGEHLRPHPCRAAVAVPPLRQLHPGRRVHTRGRARPQRAGDQADAVPRRANSPIVDALMEARRERQAGGGAGGAQGPLRRREQHRLGPSAGRRGRARGLRRAGPEDARQDVHGRAPRERRHRSATCTWPPATTTRSRAASTPTSAFFTCDPDIGADVIGPVQRPDRLLAARTRLSQAAGGAGQPARASSSSASSARSHGTRSTATATSRSR